MRCMSNAELRLSRGTGWFMLPMRSCDCEGRLRGIVPDTMGNPATSRRGGSGGAQRSRGGSMGASGAWRTCCGGVLSIRGCSLGRRGGRGGGGRGLGGGAGGGGNVTKVVVTWGGHGADGEEPFTPPIAACCEVIVGDVAGEVAAEFNTSVVPFPDITLVGADWPGPGDWFPGPAGPKRTCAKTHKSGEGPLYGGVCGADTVSGVLGVSSPSS